MSRRTRAPRRPVLADPLYGSELLSRFINMIMKSGKKSVAESIVYGAIDVISKTRRQSAEEALALLERGLENVKPTVEVRSRRVGGATYQVPVEVRAARRDTLAMRWMIEAARKRSEKTMAERMARELMDASENTGAAARRREETHRMAEANKAFAHYRW